MPFPDGGISYALANQMPANGGGWPPVAPQSLQEPVGGNAVDSVDFDALEGLARGRMPEASFAFCAAGADDEISAVENIAAWRNLRLRPHVLRDVTTIDTSVTLLGNKHPHPILIAPTGRHKLFHAEGEKATARGAASAGAPYVMASNANVLIEEVAKERKTAPQWFQLYYWPNRSEVESLIDRLAANGFSALVLTVDAPTGGWSPRAARAQHEPSPDILNINMPGSPMARTFYHPDFAGKVLYPATWRELEWLVKRSPVPVMVKGVLRADDAVRLRRARRQGHHRLQSRRPPSRHHGDHRGGDRRDRRGACRQGRGLCRRRHPPRHRHCESAGARRPRRAHRPAGDLGPQRAMAPTALPR